MYHMSIERNCLNYTRVYLSLDRERAKRGIVRDLTARFDRIQCSIVHPLTSWRFAECFVTEYLYLRKIA